MHNNHQYKKINNVIDMGNYEDFSVVSLSQKQGEILFDDSINISESNKNNVNFDINLSSYEPSFNPSININSISDMDIEGDIISIFKNNSRYK